jgi:hypothetical protein
MQLAQKNIPVINNTFLFSSLNDPDIIQLNIAMPIMAG